MADDEDETQIDEAPKDSDAARFQWQDGDVVYTHIDGTPLTPDEIDALVRDRKKVVE